MAGSIKILKALFFSLELLQAGIEGDVFNPLVAKRARRSAQEIDQMFWFRNEAGIPGKPLLTFQLAIGPGKLYENASCRYMLVRRLLLCKPNFPKELQVC